MKRFLMIVVASMVASVASAQLYYSDASNPELMRHILRKEAQRHEVVIPQVRGYEVYKADLHTHTFFSDGHTSPEWRVKEAWYDGLDILAITDHIEARPFEGKMLAFLKGYVGEDVEVVNVGLSKKPADERGIISDLNYSVRLAEKAAKAYDMTIIPGIEITRNPETIGHYNALFTTDNNKIYDVDAGTAIRNARAQGALIMHNHPGWRRKNLDYTEVEKPFYDEGLIDGVEVMNGAGFYPSMVDRAKERGLFMCANTDIHDVTAEFYKQGGHHRNMTLILAKDKSRKSIREALEAHRTIAYAFGSLAGEEQLLKDLFMACVKFSVLTDNGKGNVKMKLTNMSSITYYITFGGNILCLEPFSAITASLNKERALTFTVKNMCCGEGKTPNFVLKF